MTPKTFMSKEAKHLADYFIRRNSDIDPKTGFLKYHKGWGDIRVAQAIGDELWGKVPPKRRAGLISYYRSNHIAPCFRLPSRKVRSVEKRRLEPHPEPFIPAALASGFDARMADISARLAVLEKDAAK